MIGDNVIVIVIIIVIIIINVFCMGVNVVSRTNITSQVTLDVSENGVLGEYLTLTGRK